MSEGGPRGLLPRGRSGDLLSCLKSPLPGGRRGGEGERPLFPDPRALFSGLLMSGGGPRRSGTPGPRLYMGGRWRRPCGLRERRLRVEGA